MIKINTSNINNIKVGETSASKVLVGSTLVWEQLTPHVDVSINYVQFSVGQYIDTGIYFDDLSQLDPSGQSGVGFEYQFEITSTSNNSTIWVVPANGSNPTFYNKYEFGKGGLTAYAWNGVMGGTGWIDTVNINTLYNIRIAIARNKATSVKCSFNNAARTELTFGYSSSQVFPHSTIKIHEDFENSQGLRIYSFDMLQNSSLLTDGTWGSPALKYSLKPVLHWVNGSYVPCLKDIINNGYYYPNTGTLIYG